MKQSAQLPFDAPPLKAAGEATRLRVLVLLAAELTVSVSQIWWRFRSRAFRVILGCWWKGFTELIREGSWAFFRLAERGGAAGCAALIARLDPADPVIT
jgi:hypothetical protein